MYGARPDCFSSDSSELGNGVGHALGNSSANLGARSFSSMSDFPKRGVERAESSVGHSDQEYNSGNSAKSANSANSAALISPLNMPKGQSGYCSHKIFGRGKIIQHIPPDKYRVNFPGFGLKVIMANFLILEE